MKIKNRDIRMYVMAYNEASQERLEMKFSTLFKFQKNMKKISDINELINDTLREINEKYEDAASRQEEFEALGEVENDVDIQMIPLSEFDGVTCSNKFMAAIYFMIDEDK